MIVNSYATFHDHKFRYEFMSIKNAIIMKSGGTKVPEENG